MQPKTCFVISPIGDEGSDIRQHANDFLELLVEPALAPFAFTIVRADRIARPSIISNDIVELVQQSDLCLVDLTFHNPNVFYECGRRHETGRPTIQLMKKGENLPFDVAGIRTIEYDLSDPRSTLASVNIVKEFVGQFEATAGYGAKSSGVSLSTIAATLSRIEGKLLTTTDIPFDITPIKRKDLISMHPGEAFNQAMERGDLESARFVLPRVKKFLKRSSYIAALAALSEAADESSKNELFALIPQLIETKSDLEIMSAITGITDFYLNTESAEQGIAEIRDIVYEFVNDDSNTKEGRAFVLNRLQKLRYRNGAYGDALADSMRCVELAPDDESYHFNLSVILERLERYPEAARSAEKFVQLATGVQPDHIEYFKEIMGKVGRLPEAEALLKRFG